MKNPTICLLLLLCITAQLNAQDKLLEELEAESTADSTKNIVSYAFKGLKIVNFESTKLASKGDFYFIVAHRFGSVQNGFDDLFGLDNAVTRLSFLYGFTDWLNVGIARSSFQKTYGVHVKYKILSQTENGFPVNITGYNLVTANTQLDRSFLPGLEFNNRLAFTSQVLISRKFSKEFSFQLAPSLLHENLVSFDPQDNTQFILGMGGRYKISKRVSINADYGWHLNRAENSPFNNSLSVGVDIETGGHVFQLHFTNAQPMFENGFLANGTGDWSEGIFFFGFNLSRVF